VNLSTEISDTDLAIADALTESEEPYGRVTATMEITT
jgi:hypothetical protein